MKLLLSLLMLILPQTQTATPDSCDLVILKFKWDKYSTGSGLIRSVQEVDPPRNEPIRINPSPRANEPENIRNARDMQERKADLRGAEQDAALSRNKAASFYIYRIEVKNTGPKLVKSFVWGYQTSAEAQDSSTRQFLCAVKTKPNETKGFEVLSSLSPSKVVNVADVGAKSQKSPGPKAVIHKVDYSDGSTWQRPGWDSSILPPASQKVMGGKCVAL